jgi:superkiller protein 3
MGYAYQGLLQYDEAITAFSEYLVQLESVDLRAVYEIGVSYYQLENYQEAIHSMDEILKFEAKDTEAMLLKAYSLEKQENYEEAMLILEAIIEIEPNHTNALEEILFIQDNNLR